MVDVGFVEHDAERAARRPLAEGVLPAGLSRRKPSSGSSSISTSAIIQLVEGSNPGKSMPAALRTRLRPPSQPTRYAAESGGRPDSSTSTPSSSCAKPTTSRPRMVGTPSSATQSARIGSNSLCHRARP